MNVSLIGMPGSGKSFVGAALAERLSFQQIDTDHLIESHSKTTLQDYIDRRGYIAMRALEGHLVSSLVCTNTVISTGGSVVYSDAAVSHLRSISTVIYLSVSAATMSKRIGDFQGRGLAIKPGTDLTTLYKEREPLYRRAAQYIVDADADRTEVVEYITRHVARTSTHCLQDAI